MNESKPVAWTDNIGGFVDYGDDPNYPIPLYTTPQTKPLTEDELKKLADDYVNAYGYPFPAVSYGLEIQKRLGIK